jgi:hypothetical protein
MLMTLKYMSLLAVTSLLPLAGSAGTFDFNTPLSLNAGFNATGANKFTQTTSSGLLGGGGVVASDATSQGNRDTINTFNAGTSSFTVSSFFQWQANINTSAGGVPFMIGVTETSSDIIPFASGGLTTDDYIGLSVANRSSVNVVRLQYTDRISSTVNFLSSSATVTLTPGDWYDLTFQLILSGSTYTLNSSLDDWGASGASLVGNVTSKNGVLATDSTLAGDTTASAFFTSEGLSQDRGLGAVDNFSVSALPVPEPSTSSILRSGTCGLILSFALARKRAKLR